MSVKAYVTDLDGTLLRPDQTLSAYTAEVAARLQHSGAVFTYATARGYLSSSRVTGRIAWKHPIILYNGALIYDGAAHKVVDGYWLDASVTNDIIAAGRKHGITPLLFTLNELDREAVLHEPIRRPGERAFRQSRGDDPRFKELSELICPADHRTLSITYIGLPEELQPLSEEVRAQWGDSVHCHFMKDYYIENHYFLEFSHSSANKREGLKLWAKHMDIDVRDITVFGDQLNDLGLFEAGGKKVAVSNAHPDIIARADYITAGNGEDGVAQYLERELARLTRVIRKDEPG
ncbi:HAD-IIB family hydrolase [Paenibacillus thailandensis]|uniref:HAD-IIB family hydrolase n=1 Tax=Paenibacillus thailandensis TaxID=393250 RepID=A0ABW5R081_9BACL